MENPELEALEAAQDIYPSLKGSKYIVLIYRGCLAFQYGPFTGPEAGKILVQCQAEKIPLIVRAECGVPFDWELARDLRGEEVSEADAAKNQGKDLLGLLLTTARTLRNTLSGTGPDFNKTGFVEMEEVLKPFETDTSNKETQD